jgi:hypothetical protein
MYFQLCSSRVPERDRGRGGARKSAENRVESRRCKTGVFVLIVSFYENGKQNVNVCVYEHLARLAVQLIWQSSRQASSVSMVLLLKSTILEMHAMLVLQYRNYAVDGYCDRVEIEPLKNNFLYASLHSRAHEGL